ncbi:hypothetical protein OQA88_8097 [Cercophora sp. LCS_1]
MADVETNTDRLGSAADASHLERQERLGLWLQDPTPHINHGRLSCTPKQWHSEALAALAQFEKQFSQNGQGGG